MIRCERQERDHGLAWATLAFDGSQVLSVDEASCVLQVMCLVRVLCACALCMPRGAGACWVDFMCSLQATWPASVLESGETFQTWTTHFTLIYRVT